MHDKDSPMASQCEKGILKKGFTKKGFEKGFMIEFAERLPYTSFFTSAAFYPYFIQLLEEAEKSYRKDGPFEPMRSYFKPEIDTSDWPKFEKSVSCLCWAYNEEILIEEFLLRIHGFLDKTVKEYEIVVIDDGSTDKTNAIIRSVQQKIPVIRLVENHKNSDCGFSLSRAVYSAQKEYLFWQTVDWSYDISSLRIYLELLREYDLVAGVRVPSEEKSRFLNGFGLGDLVRRSDSIDKAIVSLFNYLIIRFLFQIPLNDFQNVVLYPTRLIQSIQYESKSAFANPEGLIKCFWKGVRMIEVPISFISRSKGEAKGTRLKAILASVDDIFRLWFQWVVLGQRQDKGEGRIDVFSKDHFMRIVDQIDRLLRKTT